MRYKYLNYVPAPVHLEPNMYDLVDDDEFCIPDGRTPLLIVVQYGIFPNGCYKGKKDYSQLMGLENQNVGFIGRGYLSKRERKEIIEYLLDPDTLKQIRNKDITINLSLWSKKSIIFIRPKKMEHVYIGREKDKSVITEYKKIFEVKTLEELVVSYNGQVKCGITGVHRQALCLMALRQEFRGRLKESPVYLLEHVLGLVGTIEVVNGHIKIME
tara:strand:+ start:177 stop:818 length:642 start_codon:yes stop_codon:yes gene_type:complete